MPRVLTRRSSNVRAPSATNPGTKSKLNFNFLVLPLSPLPSTFPSLPFVRFLVSGSISSSREPLRFNDAIYQRMVRVSPASSSRVKISRRQPQVFLAGSERSCTLVRALIVVLYSPVTYILHCRSCKRVLTSYNDSLRRRPSAMVSFQSEYPVRHDLTSIITSCVHFSSTCIQPIM